MDVPMFITRKLQPPPEVNIPEELFQRFQSSSVRDNENDSLSYDFTLERYVCTKISEWVRNSDIERMNRDERVRVKEIEKARQIEEKHKQLLTAVQYDDLSSEEEEENNDEPVRVVEQESKKFSPSHINFDTILQPTIVPNVMNPTSTTSNSCKLLNYSDFETIESSPFDNVELKTINDLDILAQVLQTHSTISTNSQDEENKTEANNVETTETPLHVEEKVECELPKAITISNAPVFPPYHPPLHNGNHKPSAQNVQLIPDILKGLNNEILQSETRRSQSTDRESQNALIFKLGNKPTEVEKPKPNNSEDNFSNLSPKSQNLVANICQMGFPMERVIKIVDKLGEKEKEIVDHLIPLSELLDLGFEEQKVSDALLKFDNNKEKALDFLIS